MSDSIELDEEGLPPITGGGVATSSLLYLVLPVIMGLLLRYTRLTVGWATVIFLPLVGVAIWAGQKIPLDIEQLFDLTPLEARRGWNVALLGYCFVASVIPMWLLLQPRGHLGGYFLYLALGGGMLGVVVGGLTGGGKVEYPEFTGWVTPRGEALFPMLFVTIACGACSGFHSVIASGTTSKQLRRETDARVIGYGAMLLEAMVAVVSLSCVMRLSLDHKLIGKDPNYLYAVGVGDFLTVLGIPVAFGVSFALMAFTTFVYDTLDVCTRLGRYILQELTGRHDRLGRWGATAATAAVPLYFLLQPPALGPDGKPLPAWKIFWNLFGASNQLLAALTLIGVTVWLWQTRRAWWVWLVTGLPAALMYVMSTWALIGIIQQKFADGLTYDPVPWVAVVLIGLAALMLAEAAWVIVGPKHGLPAKWPWRPNDGGHDVARKTAINPFYPLLVAVSVVFVITACAYGVMTVRALAPGGADGNHPLLAFLDRNGMLLLLTEVAVLAVVSFLAMGTDRYWAERGADRRDE